MASPHFIEVDIARTAWMADAACRNMDQHIFFPEHGKEDAPIIGHGSYKTARSICGPCPVKQDCLDYAMHAFAHCNDDYGMWGGTTPRQRRDFRRYPHRRRLAP